MTSLESIRELRLQGKLPPQNQGVRCIQRHQDWPPCSDAIHRWEHVGGNSAELLKAEWGPA